MSQQTQTHYTVLFNNYKYYYKHYCNHNTIICVFSFFYDLVQTPTHTDKTSLNDP